MFELGCRDDSVSFEVDGIRYDLTEGSFLVIDNRALIITGIYPDAEMFTYIDDDDPDAFDQTCRFEDILSLYE